MISLRMNLFFFKGHLHLFPCLKKKKLEQAMASKTRRANVIKLRFGLDDGKTRTLEEVGKEFNVTRERIDRLRRRHFGKLRHPSRSRKLKDFLE